MILVVFVFLRSVWATAIPSIAVPLSLVGTFGVMYLAGYTIDNLSLMALTISTGFVVDDAIVVIENITRYLEQGMAPLEAALKGSSEIGFTVLSMSTSLVAVFIPILLMGGIVGRMFREFAITLSAAVAISMVVSLTTTPMMCAKLLKAHRKSKAQPASINASESWISGCLYEAYAGSLQWVLRSSSASSWALPWEPFAWRFTSTSSFPRASSPSRTPAACTGNAIGPAGYLLPGHAAEAAQYIAIIQKDPGCGPSWPAISVGSVESAGLNITLKPLAQRKVSADQVVDRLRPKLARVPGANLFLQAVQDVQIGGRMGNAQFQYTLQGDNMKDLPGLGAHHAPEAEGPSRASGCEYAICRTTVCRPA